jgi:D-proline reductase (dithiol) PrdB
MNNMKRRTPHRSFLSYIDLSREYYAAYGYTQPYKWLSHRDVSFTKLEKPLSECRVGLLTTTDLEKLLGENKQERLLSRKVYAHPTEDAPEHFYTQDLQWDRESTHTDDNDSFMPLKRLAEYAASGKIGSASPRFYGAMTDYSQDKTSKKSAPQVLQFCREDGVEALILPAL